MADRLDALIAQAVGAGLLPATATRPGGEQRPWPVVLLTALGAWLAAVPLLGMVSLLLGPLMNNPLGPYLVGALVLAGSAVVLHSRSVPLFVEQLAVPGVLVGGGSLGFGLFRDLPDAGAALVLAIIALALALAVHQAWLRVLLGVTMAGLVAYALVEPRFGLSVGERDRAWVACHVLGAVALALPLGQGRWRSQGSALESVSAGWVLATLVGLSAWAGMTFLVGGALGGGLVGEVARDGASVATGRHGQGIVWQAASALLAAVGAALLLWRWPTLRRPPVVLVGVALAVLAWFMSTLGGAVLVGACMAVTHRFRLAGAAAVAVAWIVGAFYYALWWPLAYKAQVLAFVGVVIGAAAWWLVRFSPRPVTEPAARVPLDRRALWVGVATVATLAVATLAIWQKQDLIERGEPVFVELAPVDPRSLMQGDFMRLNFRLPIELSGVPPSLAGERPKVVARRDARGVASVLRLARRDEALAAGEFLFELTPKGGGWMLVSDAWFFPEGEAERWALAKYGEFRVLPDGRALLVGMADEKLQPIKPLKE